MESEELDSTHDSNTDSLYDLEQVTSSLCDSASTSDKWG